MPRRLNQPGMRRGPKGEVIISVRGGRPLMRPDSGSMPWALLHTGYRYGLRRRLFKPGGDLGPLRRLTCDGSQNKYKRQAAQYEPHSHSPGAHQGVDPEKSQGSAGACRESLPRTCRKRSCFAARSKMLYRARPAFLSVPARRVKKPLCRTRRRELSRCFFPGAMPVFFSWRRI